MDRLFITLAALSGCLAVGLGAFGAHALRDRLSADALQVFQTGVSYQMYHALALLAVGLLLARFSTDGSVWLSAAGWLFVAGSVLFSGSLYLLALTGNHLAGRDYAAWRCRVPCGLAGAGAGRVALTDALTGKAGRA